MRTDLRRRSAASVSHQVRPLLPAQARLVQGTRDGEPADPRQAVRGLAQAPGAGRGRVVSWPRYPAGPQRMPLRLGKLGSSRSPVT